MSSLVRNLPCVELWGEMYLVAEVVRGSADFVEAIEVAVDGLVIAVPFSIHSIVHLI